MSLKFAIIEDEPPAGQRLKRLVLELRPEAVCVAEAGDGEAGLRVLSGVAPDLLFLDIEFPPTGAFGLLEEARALGQSIPPIVFVTAYDQYAIEAFRWSAWDYLLKPVERDRLRECLDKVESRLQPLPDLGPLLSALQAARRDEVPERFSLLHKGRLRIFAWSEVSHLVTENRLLFVCTPEGRFVLDRTLDELEKRLGSRFFRCHRGAMVALARVRELIPEPGGTGEVRLDTGDRVPVSRERLPELRRRVEG